MIMKTNQQQIKFNRSLLATAVLAACASSAFADAAAVAELTQPSSSVSVGVGVASGDQKDRSLFGPFNGLRENDTTLQVDLDINKRDEAAGTSLNLKGNNLGLDNRDLSVTYGKQGDWKVGADYSELVHHEVRTINSGMVGLGSTTPTIVVLTAPTLNTAPGTGADYDLKLKRVGLGLSGDKWINNNLQFEVAFRNETKTGARTFGIGYACASYVCSGSQSATNQIWALLMVPEPVDTTTRQIDAKLNYHDKQWNVSAGYYGSFFTNSNGSITASVPTQLKNPSFTTPALSTLASAATGGTSLRNVLQSPVALAPDNQAHQFYVSGSYRFAPTTNATFKVAYTHATQDDGFAANGLIDAPAGVTSLNGVIDTTLVQFGITAKPMPKLGLLANLRYEDKKDSTPKELYNTEQGTFWYNYLPNSTKVVGKAEASYQLPADVRGTFGLDYSAYDRPVPVSITEEELAGLGAVRAKNTETGYRLELRRSMSETLTGAIAYSNSKRTGGDWTSLSTNAAWVAAGLGYGQTGSASQFLNINTSATATSAGNAFPMNMVDVDRDKIKLTANWMPSDKLEVQFYLEDGKDKNATAFNPVALQKGWIESSNRQFSVDASYAVSEKWKFNGYASQGNQVTKINHSTGYMADLDTTTDSFGFGFSGKLSAALEIGATLSYTNDATTYGLRASPTTSGQLPNITQVAPSAANANQVAIGLPDVTYKNTTLSLYGKYALRKNADLRVNLIHQRAELQEWSWVNNGTSFLYQDNTTVGMNPDQSVTFLGVSYIYKF